MPKTFSALIIVHTVRSPFSARVTKSLRIREWDSLIYIGLSFHEIQVLKQTLCFCHTNESNVFVDRF